MIYRKAPPQPIRLLLRVVSVVGASAVAGAVACSSSSGAGGSVAEPQDAAADHGDSGFMGVTDGGGFDGPNGFTDAGGGIMGATDGQVSDVLTGTVANPDSGACDEGCGLVGNPDAGSDVVTGVVVHPDSGTD